MNDRISDLPDDILIHIISSLTLKEARSTSVLSKRWRHVWAYVPSLHFGASKFCHEWFSYNSSKMLDDEKPKYFRWVDQVVSSHRAHTIYNFMVQFKSLLSDNGNVDKWVKFAMEKKVKRLQLDILMGCTISSYTFPSSPAWKTLISLELRNVDVNGETLQQLLSDCQNLEILSVHASDSLVSLRVVDPPSLKYLEISQKGCIKEMEYLEISAPKLISFYYDGNELLSSTLKCTPKLAELYIRGYYGAELLKDFSHFSSYISQLEVLALSTGGYRLGKPRVCPFPVGPKLKTLQVNVEPFSTVWSYLPHTGLSFLAQT